MSMTQKRRITTIGTLAAAAVLTATLAGATPASATTGGWFRSPNPAFDEPAGTTCAFPVHVAPVVDQVYGLTTKTFPDGTPSEQIYAGPLIDIATNTDNGRTYRIDASGTAVIDYGTDGSQTWYVVGPVLIGEKPGRGNLPQGLWIINGVYTIAFAPDGFKTVTLVSGTEDNVCGHIA